MTMMSSPQTFYFANFRFTEMWRSGQGDSPAPAPAPWLPLSRRPAPTHSGTWRMKGCVPPEGGATKENTGPG